MIARKHNFTDYDVFISKQCVVMTVYEFEFAIFRNSQAQLPLSRFL